MNKVFIFMTLSIFFLSLGAGVGVASLFTHSGMNIAWMLSGVGLFFLFLEFIAIEEDK